MHTYTFKKKTQLIAAIIYTNNQGPRVMTPTKSTLNRQEQFCYTKKKEKFKRNLHKYANLKLKIKQPHKLNINT